MHAVTSRISFSRRFPVKDIAAETNEELSDWLMKLYQDKVCIYLYIHEASYTRTVTECVCVCVCVCLHV